MSSKIWAIGLGMAGSWFVRLRALRRWFWRVSSEEIDLPWVRFPCRLCLDRRFEDSVSQETPWGKGKGLFVYLVRLVPRVRTGLLLAGDWTALVSLFASSDCVGIAPVMCVVSTSSICLESGATTFGLTSVVSVYLAKSSPMLALRSAIGIRLTRISTRVLRLCDCSAY